MLKKRSDMTQMPPQNVLEEKLKQYQTNKVIFDLVKSFVIVFVVCFVLFNVIMGLGIVRGDSMNPSLYNKDLAILWRLKPTYQQGDMVYFQRDGEKKYLIKRVIAGPGDTIIINQFNEVEVNGEVLEEDYIYSDTIPAQDGVTYPIDLGEDEYFVLGDNRGNSRDSRIFGIVDKQEIKGEVICIFRGKQG